MEGLWNVDQRLGIKTTCCHFETFCSLKGCSQCPLGGASACHEETELRPAAADTPGV